MAVSEYIIGPTPESFRGFIEGVQSLKDYLRTNEGDTLNKAEEQLHASLDAYPDFAPAQYYQAIVLTHMRKSDDAISLLERVNGANPPFKAEALYYLAFAYARKYDYDLFKKALSLLGEANKAAHYRLAGLSIGTKRPDLVLLIKAMRAWVMAAFAGRTYGHKDDFEARQLEYLPKCISLARSVLTDARFKSLAPQTKTAIEVEANNAAGIAYMRMGQRSSLFAATQKKEKPNSWFGLIADRDSELFGKSSEDYWALSKQHFESALRVHPGDVRVLDNVSTLYLIKACDALIRDDQDAAQRLSKLAKEVATTSISQNRHDRFRHYNLAKALGLLDEWDAARQAAQDIKKEPGKISDESVDKFVQAAIEVRNKDVIVRQYYDIPMKSPSEQLRH